MDTRLKVRRTRSAEEIAMALEIRRRVFVEEQGIPADLDEDGLDGRAIHVLAWLEGVAIATGRLVVEGCNAGAVARIAVVPARRGNGIGRAVLLKLEELAYQAGLSRLELHPHTYLEKFYSDLGYSRVPGGTTVGPYDLLTMVKSLEDR